MNWKPTKWKIVVSVVAVVLWFIWIIFKNSYTFCLECAPPICEADYYNFLLFKSACGGCFCHSLGEVVLSNILNIIIPFAIVYIIWSLIEKPKKRKK